MDFQQALKLLEDGMTLDEVMELRKAEAKQPKPEDTKPKDTKPVEDKKAESKPEIPKWAETLNGNIEKLTRTIQAQALTNASLGGGAPQSVQQQADSVLSGLFAAKKKEEK